MKTKVFLVVGALLVGGYFSWQTLGSLLKTDMGSLLLQSAPSTTSIDYNWKIRDLKGNEFPFAETRGKVLFINFWATWCSPCKAEMPSIQRLYEQLHGESVLFICASGESRDKVAQFMDKKRFTFPVYTFSGEIPPPLKSGGIPATFIISRDGQIAFKHVGTARWDDPKAVDFIKGLTSSRG